MPIQLRPMTVDDTPAISALTGQLGYLLPLSQTRENIEQALALKDQHALVAEEDFVVIGWINVRIVCCIESMPFAEIVGLVVDEKHRGRGVGKALVEAAKKWSVQMNMTTLRLRSNAIRTEAHRFNDKLGFGVVKEQKVFELALNAGKQKGQSID